MMIEERKLGVLVVDLSWRHEYDSGSFYSYCQGNMQKGIQRVESFLRLADEKSFPIWASKMGGNYMFFFKGGCSC